MFCYLLKARLKRLKQSCIKLCFNVNTKIITKIAQDAIVALSGATTKIAQDAIVALSGATYIQGVLHRYWALRRYHLEEQNHPEDDARDPE